MFYIATKDKVLNYLTAICPDGYEKVSGTSQCLKNGDLQNLESTSFQQAYDVCAADGAHLYHPQSKEEMKLVADFLLAKPEGKDVKKHEKGWCSFLRGACLPATTTIVHSSRSCTVLGTGLI